MARKIAWVLGLVLAITGLATGVAWWLVVGRPLPEVDGLLKVPGLRAPVEIRRDSWGIPHIRAENENDLLLAQGYVQAQDRLWQMEMSRRLAAGRLAEIVGPDGVETDRWSLTMGFYRAAGRELESYDDFHRGLLQSYSDGVNACLESRGRSLPLEFRLSGCRPEPWQAVDSLAWAKVMAYSGGGNWQEEVVRALLVSRLGEEKAGDLLGRNLPRTRFLLSTAAGFGPAKALEVRNRFQPGLGGSNAWVIHGSRTARGFPLLANDLHLPVRVPSAWHEIHLSGGGFDVAGLSWPGFPLVLTGHNRHLAWGAALAHVDSQDIFYEKMSPRRQGDYLFQEQWLPAEHLIEEIRVKGGEPVRHEVRLTRHGPLINPVTPRLRLLRQAMALKWAGQDSGEFWPALRLLNLSENRDEFERAAQRWSEPALSLVYGDRAGHIGYVLAGRVPLRAGGDAPGPYPGWTGEYEWTGYLDPAAKPVRRDPEEGYLVVANQRVAGPEAPPYLGQDYDPGFRAARISEVLADNDRMTMEDCRRLQMDVKCAMAENFLTALKTVDPNRLRDRRGFDILTRWDLNMESDSQGAAIWAVLIRRLLVNTFRDELGDAADLFFGESWSPREAPNLFTGHSLVILDGLINEPQGVWFDDVRTPEREALADLLVKSLDEATLFLADQLGDEAVDWSWGRLHQINLLHPLGQGRLLDYFLNLGPYPGRGWNITLMQSMVAPGGDFGLRGATAGNRHLYDLGDWELGRGVIAPGESGMYGSPHYRDQMDLWLRGQGHALPYSTEEVNRHSGHILTLVPGD